MISCLCLRYTLLTISSVRAKYICNAETVGAMWCTVLTDYKMFFLSSDRTNKEEFGSDLSGTVSVRPTDRNS